MSKARFDTIESLSTGKQVLVDELFGKDELSSAEITTATGTQTLVDALESRVTVFESFSDLAGAGLKDGQLANIKGTLLDMPVGTTTTRMISAITPEAFGAKGDNTTDDYAAIRAALDYARDNQCAISFRRSGNYLTSQPIVIDFTTIIHFNRARLKPLSSSAVHDVPLLSIRDTSNVSIYDPIINFEYINNFSAGFGIFNSQYCNVYNPACLRMDVGYEFGDRSPAINSENNIYGATTFSTPTSVITRGHNTFIHGYGCHLVGSNDYDVSQNSKQIVNIRNEGGAIMLNGGGAVSPQGITTGSIGSGYPINFYMSPSDYRGTEFEGQFGDGRYGVIRVDGTFLETTGRQLFTQANAFTAPSGGDFSLDHCGYYTGSDNTPFLSTDPLFSGRLRVINCSPSSSTVTRTQPNIACGNAVVEVYTDTQSWGNGFLGYLGIGSGLLKHDMTSVLNASNTSAMSYTAGANTLTTYSSNLVAGRFSSLFDGTSFTVPEGGYRVLSINATMDITTTSTEVELSLFRNGVETLCAVLGREKNTISWTQRDATAGTTFEVRVRVVGASGTGKVSGNAFQIIASSL